MDITNISAARQGLSIIVPLLNEAAQLPALLKHLQHWQARGCEVLIVDGGSTDGSTPLLEASPVPVLQAPRGRARQMNAGAGHAAGKILIFLHADTRLPPEADVLVQSVLRAGTHYWGRFDVELEGNHWMLPVIGWMMNRRSRLTGVATGDQALFVTADTFSQVGGFAELPLMEDIQLSRRLRRISSPACLPQKVTTSGRRWLQQGVWRTIWLMWCLRWAYWRGTPASTLAERYQ